MFIVLIASHYLLVISCKRYNYMFEFVTVMSKVMSVFFPGHGVYTLCLKTPDPIINMSDVTSLIHNIY